MDAADKSSARVVYYSSSTYTQIAAGERLKAADERGIRVDKGVRRGGEREKEVAEEDAEPMEAGLCLWVTACKLYTYFLHYLLLSHRVCKDLGRRTLRLPGEDRCTFPHLRETRARAYIYSRIYVCMYV